jgi:MSHA pilin protein MshA
MKGSAKQGGFTLIELAVVITILAILAAFAIPRFVSLEAQARTASRNALMGSLRSGAALAHALWMANNQVGPITMEGKSITIVNGYPSAGTIANTLADTSGYTMTTAGTAATFESASLATCTASYTQAPANAAPVIAAGAGAC